MKYDKNFKCYYYKNIEDMTIVPRSVLMNKLIDEIAVIRGKLGDLKGLGSLPEDIDHIEGLLTCGIIAMSDTADKWRKWENKP